MKTKVLVRVAATSLLKNKLRSMLTMLGVIIGVGSVILMVAVGDGARSRIQQQVQKLGTNMIVVTPGSSNQGGVSQGAQSFNRLTLEDAEKPCSATSKGRSPSPPTLPQPARAQNRRMTLPNSDGNRSGSEPSSRD